MKTIYKFTVKIREVVPIELPHHSEILSFGMQNGVAVIWVLLDTQKATSVRRFTVIGTGWEDRNKDLEHHRFVGTATEDGFVWHCFEVWKR